MQASVVLGVVIKAAAGMCSVGLFSRASEWAGGMRGALE